MTGMFFWNCIFENFLFFVVLPSSLHFGLYAMFHFFFEYDSWILDQIQSIRKFYLYYEFVLNKYMHYFWTLSLHNEIGFKR